MKLLNNVRLSILLSGLMLVSNIAFAGVSVIVHPDSSETSLSAKQIKKIFMGKVKQTPSGQMVIAVDQPENSSATAEFNQKIIKKNAARIKAYWTKMIMSGKGSKPKVLANDDAIKKWIANNADAIGYIDSGAVDNFVKVVFSVD
jgi:ABC-type phosphate transport system substrate-binding protein